MKWARLTCDQQVSINNARSLYSTSLKCDEADFVFCFGIVFHDSFKNGWSHPDLFLFIIVLFNNINSTCHFKVF